VKIVDLVNNIPDEILNNTLKAKMIDSLHNKISNNWYLNEVLDKLKSYKVESKAERKKRINKNQEDFLNTFKKRI